MKKDRVSPTGKELAAFLNELAEKKSCRPFEERKVQLGKQAVNQVISENPSTLCEYLPNKENKKSK